MKLRFWRRNREPRLDPAAERLQALENFRAEHQMMYGPTDGAPERDNAEGVLEPEGVAEAVAEAVTDAVVESAEPPAMKTVDPALDLSALITDANPPATNPIASAEAAADPLASAQPAPDPLGGGGDLLDLFREEKQEAVSGGLASEVEDVSIESLLDDLAGISSKLGVWRPQTIVRQVQRQELEQAAAAEPGPDPVLRVEKVEPQALVEEAGLETGAAPPEIEEEAIEIDVEALMADEPEETPPPARPRSMAEPEMHLGGYNNPIRRPSFPRADSRRGSGGRGAAMHLVVLLLVLGLVGGLGVRQASQNIGGGVSVQAIGPPTTSPTPVVLMYFRSPDPTPKPTKKATPSPTATPSPSPTASPTPTPAPTAAPRAAPPRRVDFQPPYFVYKVQSGDSLMSISQQFGLCPDHILWNNPEREETTPLNIGDRMVIPGAPGVIHEVQRGETLQAIALLYNIRPEAITDFSGNQVLTDEDLVPGRRLLVPNGIPQSSLNLDDEARWAMEVPSEYGFVWPFYAQVTTFYGEERPGYIHRAIDIGGLGNYGTTVGAAASGTVVFVGDDSVYGKNVIIQHEDESKTRYAHFAKTYVKQGQAIEQSSPVGALGCTGMSTGTHLHFEMWRDGSPVDPLLYLP